VLTGLRRTESLNDRAIDGEPVDRDHLPCQPLSGCLRPPEKFPARFARIARCLSGNCVCSLTIEQRNFSECQPLLRSRLPLTGANDTGYVEALGPGGIIGLINYTITSLTLGPVSIGVQFVGEGTAMGSTEVAGSNQHVGRGQYSMLCQFP
jgi:hypothetical protein